MAQGSWMGRSGLPVAKTAAIQLMEVSRTVYLEKQDR
jgi:hypothetical protein